MRIGIVSDTHGLLRPDALAALKDVGHIIHAGDIGSPDIIGSLGQWAPVTAVRGNVDGDAWAREFPANAAVQLGGALIYVVHNIDDLDIDPRAAGVSAVVYGHSHCPAQELRDGVLFFNPGSIGPRRFRLPVAMGFLTIDAGAVSAEIRVLE